MESFLPSEIARLVLGYLEDNKCDEAYDIFLRTSPNLKECLKMKEDGKKFRTQVLGLSLMNILYEYSTIYSLIDERLKKVDPETSASLKNSGSLMDKLNFLLNATGSGQTMLFSITLPPGKSPSVAHVRKRLKSNNYDRKKDSPRKTSRFLFECNSNNDETENINEEPTLEATSLYSLPGNAIHNSSLDSVSGDTGISHTPKRSLNYKKDRFRSISPQQQEDSLDLSILTKACLDNHELHEKIAENINKIIQHPELSNNIISQSQNTGVQNTIIGDKNSTNSNNFGAELDNAIKKIVEQTESDPIFENLLQEIIVLEPSKETNDDNDKQKDTLTTPKPDKVQSASHIKKRLRSAKSKPNEQNEMNISNIIENQNAAAIECIISVNSQSNELEKPTESAQNDIEKNQKEQKQEKQNCSSPEMIFGFPEPEPDSTVQKERENIQKACSSFFYDDLSNIKIDNPNKNIVVIEPPQICTSQQVGTIIAEATFPSVSQQPIIGDNKVIVVSSKIDGSNPQILTVQPTSFLSQATVLKDTDILNMPTVIMCENPQLPSKYVIPSSVSTMPTTTGRKNPVKILPKISDVELFNEVIRLEEKEIDIQNKFREGFPKPIEISIVTGTEVSDKSDMSDSKKNISIEKIENKVLTPRSNLAHVRALDFSTPIVENQQKSTKLRSSAFDNKPAKVNPIFSVDVNQVSTSNILEEKTSDNVKNVTNKSKSIDWDLELRKHIKPVEFVSKKKVPLRRYKKRDKTTTIKKAVDPLEKKLAELEEETTVKQKKIKGKKNMKKIIKRKTKVIHKTELDVVEKDTDITEDNTSYKDNLKKSNNKKTSIREIENTCIDETKDDTVTKKDDKQNEKEPAEENNENTNQSDDTKSKYITPVMEKLFDSNPISTKKNLVPILETPFKDMSIPLTPGVITPLNDISISKLLEQNCGSIDYSTIMTPIFPLTPNIPEGMKLGGSCSSYVSRPTDYSNSSSYYQPSDTEQNQKIENLLIEECKRSAKKIGNLLTSTPTKTDNSTTLCKEPEDKLTTETIEHTINMEIFMELSNSPENETIIPAYKSKVKPSTPTKPKKSPKKSKSKISPIKIKLPKKKEKEVDSKSRKNYNSHVTKSQKTLLDELENKRRQIILEMKELPQKREKTKKTLPALMVTRSKSKLNSSKNTDVEIKKPEIKQKQTPVKRKKTLKRTKSIELVAAQLLENKNKIEDEKQVQSKTDNSSKQTKINEKIFNDSFEDECMSKLQISSDDEPGNTDETDKLVKTLKERGIHLIPNKTKSVENLKDDDNPDIINSQQLNLSVNIFENKSSDKSRESLNDKIQIKDDIHLDKFNAIDVSKMTLANSIVTDKIYGKDVINNKQNPVKLNKEENIKQSDSLQNKTIVSTIGTIAANTSISSDYSETDVEFHAKVITEDSPETIKLIYNKSTATKKTISDYDFSVLQKQISATVFSEELNIEQERVMSVTPFIELFSLNINKKNTVNSFKPLDILYKEIENSSDEGVDNKATEKPKEVKITKPTSKKQNENKTKKLDDRKQKFHDRSKKKVEDKSKKKTEDKSKTTDENNHLLNEEMDSAVSKDNDVNFDEEEDLLMTLAVTGTDIKDKKCSSNNFSARKRKASDTKISEDSPGKRIKQNEVYLENIMRFDVDTFLSKLHGPFKS